MLLKFSSVCVQSRLAPPSRRRSILRALIILLEPVTSIICSSSHETTEWEHCHQVKLNNLYPRPETAHMLHQEKNFVCGTTDTKASEKMDM